jgi:hypothetical protein
MKQSGLGDALYVGGYDLSGDINSLSRIGTSRTALDFTAIDKEGFERKGGIRDGAIEFTSYFNPSAGQAHPILSALPTTDVMVSYLRGTTVGTPSACTVAKQVGYDPTRGADGSLTMTTSALANGFGLEWGVMLTAGKQTDTTATDSDGLDQTAQTTDGAQAYLQVFSFTGTSCTVSIEDSADDNTYAPLIAFTAATGVTTERDTVSGTVDRYVRISTTGTFSECTFAVMFKRNKIETVF